LECKLTAEFKDLAAEVQSTRSLGKVRIADADFDDPQGEEIIFDRDYLGKSQKGTVGPLSILQKGANRVKIWTK